MRGRVEFCNQLSGGQDERPAGGRPFRRDPRYQSTAPTAAPNPAPRRPSKQHRSKATVRVKPLESWCEARMEPTSAPSTAPSTAHSAPMISAYLATCDHKGGRRGVGTTGCKGRRPGPGGDWGPES